MKAKIPGIVKAFYPRRIWQGPAEGKVLYLTFDDGPIAGITPWVLEQLSIFQAKATFFCIGDNVRKHPEIYQRLVTEGHAVGNHTFNHLNGWKATTEEYLENTLKAQQTMKDFSKGKGSQNMLFRPPYGRIRSKQARELVKRGFRIVMWDVLSMDYNSSISSDDCFKNVVKNSSQGSLVVFHDSLKAQKNLKTVLPRVLEFYDRLGYSFERLPDNF